MSTCYFISLEKDAYVTEKRQQALELIDHPERRGRNARQTMMMHKGGHGTGRTPVFPSREEIDANVEGLQEDHYVSTYGNGSYTTPAKRMVCPRWYRWMDPGMESRPGGKNTQKGTAHCGTSERANRELN